MRSPTEGSKALQDLCRVLLFVQVHREEGIVLVEVERRSLACAEENGDVFHLDEGHGRLLELDSRRG
jgi:hypothetical protein